MNWSSLTNIIFTFINLIFIGINAYLTYKVKTLPFREMLYSKQLDGYSEVIETLTDFYIDAQRFIVSHGFKLNDKTRPELKKQTMDKGNIHIEKHKKWAIFLPKELSNKLHNYIDLFNGISANKDPLSKYQKNIVYAEDPGKLLSDAYLKVFNTARKFLGTESLSKETLEVIGKLLSE